MSATFLFFGCMALYTAFLAVIHANYDTSTFASNKPFSHAMVWLERAMHVLIGAILLCFSLHEAGIVDAVLLTVAMGPLFSLLFRIALNGFRGKAWWYMGPDLFFRMERDSWLDGLYHKAAWMLTGRRYEQGGVVQKYPDRLPFILATAVEVILMGLLILAAVNFSTRHLPLL